MRITEAHVRALLGRLREYESTMSAHPDDPKPCRIYFVDTDVVSTYINGRPGDYIISWSSLLSMGGNYGHDNPPAVSRDARSLADTIALAVPGFLFGRFLDGLGTQRKRFYLTPEHARELNAIKLAIVADIKRTSIVEGEWLDRLQREYVELCQSAQAPERAVRSAENIVDQLWTHSEMGKLERLHAMESLYTVPLSSHLILPPYQGDRSFILDTREGNLSARVSARAYEAFEVFIQGLKSRQPNSAQYFGIKRRILEIHHPKLRMRDYVNTIANDPALAGTLPSSSLNQQTMIAVREVADVFSLARIATLAEYLHEAFPLSGDRRWQLCLITGSEMLRNLYQQWRDATPNLADVRVVHPLCFLRDSGLFDPEGAQGIVTKLHERTEGEYAIKQIRIGDGGLQNHQPIDADQFCSSLRNSLVSVAARVREQDRATPLLRLRLKHDAQFDHAQYVIAVRESIAYFFFRAFMQLNALASGSDARLPSSNIPVLSLPSSRKTGIAESETFFVELIEAIRYSREDKNRTERNKRGATLPVTDVDLGSLVERVMGEDVSGYSTMLCAGVAYIAKGRAWLGAAETMASTATMLALGDGTAAYPQGNEALYLKAFLLRMRFTGTRENSFEWLDHHGTIMQQAFDALENWRLNDDIAATEPITLAPIRRPLNRHELIGLRYEIERSAARIYVWIADLMGNPDSSRDSGGTLYGELLVELARAIERFPDLSVPDILGAHRPAVAFVRAQLWAAALQGWLCAHRELSRNCGNATSTTSNELRPAASELQDAIAMHLEGYMSTKPDSVLVRMLAEIFYIHLGIEQTRRFGIHESDFNDGQFAAFDKDIRFPFFRSFWTPN